MGRVAGGRTLPGVASASCRMGEAKVMLHTRLTTAYGVETIAFGPLTVPEHIEICIVVVEKIPVAVFFRHLPPAAWIQSLKTAEVKVWFQTGSAEQAREAVCSRVDAIVAQGGIADGCPLAAAASDISRTCLFGPEWPDAPMRVVRNRVAEEWASRDARTPPPPNPPEFIGSAGLGPNDCRMPKFSAILPAPETAGDFEEMCLAAGESVNL